MKQFSTEDPKILGDTLKYLVATATWTPRFVYPCAKTLPKFYVTHITHVSTINTFFNKCP